jgi:hypothetical protein
VQVVTKIAVIDLLDLAATASMDGKIVIWDTSIEQRLISSLDIKEGNPTADNKDLTDILLLPCSPSLPVPSTVNTRKKRKQK